MERVLLAYQGSLELARQSWFWSMHIDSSRDIRWFYGSKGKADVFNRTIGSANFSGSRFKRG